MVKEDSLTCTAKIPIMKKMALWMVSICWIGLFFACSRQAPSTPDVQTSAKAFVDLLAKGDFMSAVANFDATMKTALPATQLQMVWNSLTAQYGAFKKQGAVRTQKMVEGGIEYDVVFVTCEFEKGKLDAKVVYNKARQIAGLFFVPSLSSLEYKSPPYAKRDSFREREVQIGTGEWVLPGTMTLPVGRAPFPALVLVHGSGPNDRDETLGPNKPFRDLAWGLASRGIAVLRYEKRTKQYPEKLAAMRNLTVKEEAIDDALAAVALLRRTKEINPRKVFVLGHSLGGMLIPRIGIRDPQIGGFIVMAGITRPLEEVIVEQVSYLLSIDTLPESEKKELQSLKQVVAKIKSPHLSRDSPGLLIGAPPAYWLDLRGYHPPTVAKNLKQPILILQGGRDYQVTMADFEGWKKALSGRRNVTFRLYPKMNHLFIEGEGKSTPAEYDQPGHVAKSVIDDIANWIKTN